MPIIVDPNFVPPAPPATILSSDKIVRATVDDVNAGCLLKANFAEQVLRTNLVPNPSFRATSAVAEVRRNIATDPSCEIGGAGGWSSNNGTYWTASNDATHAHSGGKSRKCVPAAGQVGYSATILSLYNVGGGIFPVTAGKTYTVSVYLDANVAADGFVTTNFLDASGAAVGNTLIGSIVAISAGDDGWFRSILTAVAPVGATQIRVGSVVNRSAGTGNTTATDIAWADDCLVEEAAAALPYFDGDLAAADGLTYSWTGPIHASASRAMGSRPSNWAIGPDATVWCDSGKLRIIMKVPASGSAFLYQLAAIATAPGDYQSHAFELTVDADSPSGVDIEPAIIDYGDATIYSRQRITLAPGESGRWVNTMDAPASASTTGTRTVLYRYSAGALPAGTRFSVTEFIAEKVPNALTPVGPYFDGSTPETDSLEHRWTGLVDNSTSEEFVSALLDSDGNLPAGVRFYRADGSPVRSGDSAVATEGIAYAYDHETDLGGGSAWYVKPIMIDGTEGAATASVALVIPEPADESDGWLKSTINPSLCMQVRLALAEETGRQTRVTIDEVTGSQYGALTWDTPVAQVYQVTARTSGKADHDKLMSILTAGPLLLQSRDETGLPKTVHVIPIGDLAGGRLIETGAAWDHRHWPLTLREIERPSTIDTPLRIPGNTCQQLPKGYATCADLLAQVAACGTLLEG